MSDTTTTQVQNKELEQKLLELVKKSKPTSQVGEEIQSKNILTIKEYFEKASTKVTAFKDLPKKIKKIFVISKYYENEVEVVLNWLVDEKDKKNFEANKLKKYNILESTYFDKFKVVVKSGVKELQFVNFNENIESTSYELVLKDNVDIEKYNSQKKYLDKCYTGSQTNVVQKNELNEIFNLKTIFPNENLSYNIDMVLTIFEIDGYKFCKLVKEKTSDILEKEAKALKDNIFNFKELAI